MDYRLIMRLTQPLLGHGIWIIAIALAVTEVLHANDAYTSNSMVKQLVTEGLVISSNKKIPLTAPLVLDSMTSKEQEAAIAPIGEKVGLERFYKNSAVSPYVLEIETADKLDDGSQIQRVDVWFVAYGSLHAMEDKKLLNDLSSEQKKSKSGFPEGFREFTEPELLKYQMGPIANTESMKTIFGSLESMVLDRVHLAIVTRSLATRTEESVCQGTMIEQSAAAKNQLPCRWCPIQRDELGNETLGAPEDYSGAASYLKVTHLKHLEGALLIEMHVLFAEPQGWFNGRNLLRSKLPLLIQDGVRQFRRKL